MGHWGYTLFTWLTIPVLICTVQTDWMPLKSRPNFTIGPRIAHSSRHRRPPSPPPIDTCALHKVVMDQHAFHQHIQYKHHIPDLKEFTLCAWFKLYNHSVDHPIFSYALPHKTRAIYSWISNTPKKSYYMLAINGHTIYRINCAMKLHKWHHMCQSWNGRTGEWQLWLNNERIGRGYYNLMVGKAIKSGGIAISGQEQIEYGGGFHIKGKGVGLQGEITLLQLYKAALTAGKAYTDHKHHHVHQWTHDGEEENDDENSLFPTTEAPLDEKQKALANIPGIFENGQLVNNLPVHELLAKPPIKPSTIGNNVDLMSPLDHANPSATLKIKEPIFDGIFGHNYGIFKRSDSKPLSLMGKKIKIRSKRNANVTSSSSSSFEIKMQNESLILGTNDWKPIIQKRVNERPFEHKAEDEKNKSSKKRELVINEHYHSPLEFISNTGISNLSPYSDGHSIPDRELFRYSQNNGNHFRDSYSNHILDSNSNLILDNNSNHIPDSDKSASQYEPAEWEVRKIADLCSGCAEDPFRKASILSWQETPKKLFAGALYVPAIPKCHIF